VGGRDRAGPLRLHSMCFPLPPSLSHFSSPDPRRPPAVALPPAFDALVFTSAPRGHGDIVAALKRFGAPDAIAVAPEPDEARFSAYTQAMPNDKRSASPPLASLHASMNAVLWWHIRFVPLGLPCLR